RCGNTISPSLSGSRRLGSTMRCPSARARRRRCFGWRRWRSARGSPRSCWGGTRAAAARPCRRSSVPSSSRCPSASTAPPLSARSSFAAPPKALEVVATTLRRQAARNPRALLRRRPLGRAAYRQSPLVAEPLRRADVAGEAAGACAFVVTSLARARDLRRPPVAVLATMQVGLPSADRELPDFVRFDRERTMARAAQALFGAAGLPPGGADVAFFHDAASPLVLLGLEDFRFCPRGASGPFVLGGGLGGSRVNPSGGQL